MEARIPETYQWLLVPGQKSASVPVSWDSIRLASSDSLTARASNRLLEKELLVAELGPTVLQMHLNDVPLWRGDHVQVRQLVEDFGKFLYLPRLQSVDVLVDAIKTGVALLTWETDSFAYADNFDEDEKRYLGLRYSTRVDTTANSRSLVVNSLVALKQIDEVKKQHPDHPITPPGEEDDDDAAPGQLEDQIVQPTRFFASTSLSPNRIGPEASEIGEEVVAHLAGLDGSKVEISLEIAVSVLDGIPESVERAVTENCISLRIDNHDFEKN